MLFTINSSGVAQANFSALESKARSMTEDQLRYAMKDAREAERANPDGHKAGFYADEAHTYGDELARRSK
jgi:hypothetical protein